MKGALKFAVIGEVLTSLALLIVPVLVGRLLLGVELTGTAIPVARVAGIALIGLSVASGFARDVDLRRVSYALSQLPWACWRFCRDSALASSRRARGADGTSRAGLVKGARGHTNIEPMSRAL